MDRMMGIWLDHERAVIVTLAEFGTSIERERSEAGKRVRLAGGSRSRTLHGPQDVADEPSRNARYDQALHRYYGRLARRLDVATDIYICGPGEAKGELRKVLDALPGVAERIRGVEAADKMTDKQVVARVREIFARPRPRATRARG